MRPRVVPLVAANDIDPAKRLAVAAGRNGSTRPIPHIGDFRWNSLAQAWEVFTEAGWRPRGEAGL